MTQSELKILAPTGIVGYGFPEESFYAGVALKPDIIACDAGSTDPGPYYLGSGHPFTNDTAVKRDLTLMLKAARQLDIPLVIGTAGGSGADVHVARDVGILRTIAREEGLTFRLAVISAELDPGKVCAALREGRVEQLEGAPPITEDELQASSHLVAQMGIEPIIRALDDGAQVVLCGRCYDPAAFAAPAIRLGYDKALAFHLGKLLECATISATPGSGADCLMGYLGQDYFRVEPLNPARRCTPLSVSAHTLYEKSNPYLLPGPGGTLDISASTFTADTDRAVRVRGSRYIQEEVSSVKLEGAKPTGYRTISICGNRDPLFIARLDGILEEVKKQTAENLSASFQYRLDFIVYGRNGVMGDQEPGTGVRSHEVGIVIDVIADSQEEANAVCSVARSTLLHFGYEGRLATAGNLAFPFSPSDIQMGQAYEFNVYGLLRGEDALSLFPRTYMVLGG